VWLARVRALEVLKTAQETACNADTIKVWSTGTGLARGWLGLGDTAMETSTQEVAMIAACPRCAVRYRIDPAWIGPAGRRLRCARCEAVFPVRTTDLPPQAEPPPTPTSAVTESEPSGSAAQILIADAQEAHGRQAAAAVAACGLRPVLVHDGAEAMTQIGRTLPTVAVLDVALPRMRGLEICEYVKRIGPAETRIILVGSLRHRDRRYGADVYLDRSDLAEGLIPALHQLGVVASVKPAPETAVPPAPLEPAPPRPQSVRRAPEEVAPRQTKPHSPVVADTPRGEQAAAVTRAGGPLEDADLSEARAYAERLARVIVSDIALYYPDRLETANREGNVLEQLEDLLDEGRVLFRQRIDDRVAGDRDFIAEELLRVAEARKGQ
jgi:predicted Zn finger-like uncharacterized protein